MSKNKRKSKNKFFPLFFLLVLALPLTFFLSSHKQNILQRAQNAQITVKVDFSTPLMTTQSGTGASVIHENEVAFTTGGKQKIGSSMQYVNVHIMGFGADNPEPAPRQYNWGSLDRRVQMMRDTGSIKMITLCCSPDWMKGGSAGQTDWSKIEDSPLPAHFKDFAELSKQVALRYPDVQYFQVWNELKDFWNNSQNRWDYEGYTAMYNHVYDAIKSVRPTAKIGGPYIGVNMGDQRTLDVITYWLKNKHGAEFIVVDGGPPPGGNASEEFSRAKEFITFGTWLRKQPGAETLPFGWAEWYPRTSGQNYDANHFNAIIANDYMATLLSGSAYVLMWGVQGDGQGLTGDPGSPELIMTSNGNTTPVYTSMKAFKDFFPPGTQLYKTTSSSPNISVIASRTKAILINQLSTSQTVMINDKQVSLSGYQVAVVDLGGSGGVQPTTVVPTFACLGNPNSVCATLPPTQEPNPPGNTQPIGSVAPSQAEGTPSVTEPAPGGGKGNEQGGKSEKKGGLLRYLLNFIIAIIAFFLNLLR